MSENNTNQNTIKAIIVDDELSARKSLASFIQKYCGQVQIVGQASDIEQASDLIQDNTPDLVFLDIEMPGGNAFDLLDRFTEINFEIIFITAFNDYAVKAFEMSAANYLLKPLSIDALTQAVAQVSQKLQNAQELFSNRILLSNMNVGNKQDQQIVLPLIDGFELVKLSQIIFIRALDNFSQVHLEDGRKITVCRKLKHFEHLLQTTGFFRIHRSHIVNKIFIQRYHKGKGGYVVLHSGHELDVAQSRKKEFLELFGS